MKSFSSKSIKTFSIGFDEVDYNEAEHAKKVADFLSTAPPVDYAAARGYMPPQPIKFFENGHFMSTCEVTGERNMETFLMEFTENCEDTQGVSFFGKGYEYKLWGIIPTNRHILGMKDETKDDDDDDGGGGNNNDEEDDTEEFVKLFGDCA